MEGRDFYYQMMTNDDKSVVFLITPKKFYDTEGCLIDVAGAANEILPRGFTEMQPSFFRYNGNNVAIGKEMLQTIGMIEINFGLTSVKPNKSREHEADLEDNDEDEEHFEEGPANVNHGPRVEEDPYEDDEEVDEDDDDEEEEPEPEDDEEDFDNEHEDEEHLPPPNGERPVIIPRLGNLNLGPGAFNNANQPANNPPPPPANANVPSRPLPVVNETSNDLDELLSDASIQKKETNSGFDYSGMATDALLRHRKVMIDTESYMEAAKIQAELDSRGIKG
jgi:hypothetical protein